ncbi:hypothetical protein QYE76_003738 [Lolium multiflorum]|uniref:Transposase (putative) gypsy type domain-containing protein n=1 Tax=Lolium multiflorum TaxID=4521 RepID=A0AAD8RQM8_LOLMU|nr:hypothetical protein QYE76_003738 [Lolium multiflorum]
MGKKNSTSASGSSKVSRDWGASTITSREVNKLRSLGFISSSDDDIRLPGPSSRPNPPKGFTVMFVAFLFRGLSLPAHEFLRSLLFFYGIQLWQLTPNSILHLSIFITICEAFLGIDPHWGLWRKIFYVKRHNDNNAPVIGGVGFVVRKEVDYLNFPMKESVQGWRHKWFYLRDTPVPGRRSNLLPFKDVLVAQPKKSWRNALSPEESALADKLFEQVVDLKNAGGLTMCGTEVVSVFLKRRVQPLMSRPHQLWMYTGEGDKSKVEELHDEASTVVRCYPPTPESGVEPEDDDDSKETEDAQHALEDSDVQEEEAPEDDALTRSRRRRRINDELITTAESSPSGRDDDADEAASPPPLRKVRQTSSLSDDDVPLAKRAKFSSGRPESGKESNPSPAKRTPPSRATVEKIPMSKVIPSGDVSIPPAARDHPIYATVDAVADFAEQFTRLESENAHLRKTIKTSADQVLEANKLAANAQNKNTLLKDELRKLKQKVKDDQDARRKAAAAVDEKEGVLCESIANLMSAADLNINCARKLREDYTSDALSLAAESNVQVLGLLQKTKGALSRLYSMIFPRMKQEKTLNEMAESFLIDPSEPVEVLKRRSRLFGAVLTFQLLMGHGLGSELERFSEALPVDDNGHLINLEPFKSAVTCANQLLKLVDEAKTKTVPEAAPDHHQLLLK